MKVAADFTATRHRAECLSQDVNLLTWYGLITRKKEKEFLRSATRRAIKRGYIAGPFWWEWRGFLTWLQLLQVQSKRVAE
jgi:hypothetical protein